MVIFGGLSRTRQFLNDVWFFNLDTWSWRMISANDPPSAWFTDKDMEVTAAQRRGIVPARPAGRHGHTAVLSKVRNDQDFLVDVMTIMGGQSPNCSDFCPDLWHYNLDFNKWTILYGEWWGQTQVWQKMYDYNKFQSKYPPKRWAHAAFMYGPKMYLWGGHKNGSQTACCGWQCPTGSTTRSADCPFLEDFWRTDLERFVPFETQLATEKHATQSSTALNGQARLAVDGNTNCSYSPTKSTSSVSHTNPDAQAWWQVNLGGQHFITNVTLFNRCDKNFERLSNFYFLVSNRPFSSDRLQDLLKDPAVWKYHFMYVVEEKITVMVHQLGWYVRIQLAGTDVLALAEVEIFGFPPIQVWQSYEGVKRWDELDGGLVYPKARMGHAMSVGKDSANRDTVLLFGGYVNEHPFFLNDWWKFYLDTEQWEQLEPRIKMPENKRISGRHSLMMAVDKDQVFLFGGQAGGESHMNATTSRQYHLSGFKKDLWVYNISSNVLSPVAVEHPELGPAGRLAGTMLMYEDDLIVFGGSSDDEKECPGTVCDDLWTYQFVGPNSCPNRCSNHGVCEYGFCKCGPLYRGLDCNSKTCPGASCVYDYFDHNLKCQQCSDNGQCLGNGTCLCGIGWQGEKCELMKCPGNCTGHGVCKRGGFCDCDNLFGGLDCNTAYCIANCSDQGECHQEWTADQSSVKTECICGDSFTGEDCSTQLSDYWIEKITLDIQRLAQAGASTLSPHLLLSAAAAVAVSLVATWA
eukprot:CAMPEP_0114544590 /NCGR_PEP_ID=MMETSP0114-20121206/2956_1 /TAXON_ID=31324 /ORGANISM="Goniomonas sp, Strain m" /LENGTH=745 /DNA_ID=CAMNT_0001728977 /DNA_START=159 /DNA_END=2396 /DNA_ORIENTATION=+